MHGRPTTAVSSRLPNSIAECVDSSGVKLVPWQRGQSGQPRPEPVSRTAAPVKTISVQTSSAEAATQRYARGVIVNSRRRRMRAVNCGGWPAGGSHPCPEPHLR
jgi:hypothetical protein